MRIVLVTTQWTGTYGIFGHFGRKASMRQPLNLAYLAASAEARGHEVKIFDGEVEGWSPSEMARQVADLSPDLVGVTSTTPCHHLAEDFTARYKRLRSPDAPVAIGGPHVTALKAGAMGGFDYGFIGEADETWPVFLDALISGGDMWGVPGMLYQRFGRVISTGMPKHVDIESVLPPARHLLKMDRYKIGTMMGTKRFSIIIASRGCPYHCVYCSNKVFGRRVRRRSPASVVAEMRQVYEDFGTDHFAFMDDNLTHNRKWINGLCDEIDKSGLLLTFEGQTRPDIVDPDLIRRLALSGCIRLCFGLETTDTEIRETIGKGNIHMESYAEAAAICNDWGIEVVYLTMLGLPGETRQTVKHTLSYLRNARNVHEATFSIAVPYPGTEFIEMARRGDHGLRLLTEDYSRYNRYGSSVIAVNDLSADDLVRLQNDGFVTIYSAPWRWRALWKKNGIIGVLLMLLRLFRYMWHRVHRVG